LGDCAARLDRRLARQGRADRRPTPYVWIISRTQTDGPADYDAVHKIQAAYRITPLSLWGKPAEPVTGKIDPALDMKAPPKIQVDTMPAGKFFAYAAEVLKRQPPHITDQPDRRADAPYRAGARQGPRYRQGRARGQAGIAECAGGRPEIDGLEGQNPRPGRDGWSMNTDTMGVYGNYYLKRAMVTQIGLGANLPEDAIYPLNFADDTGKPLDGANRYILHFDKGATPPVSAFWSVTLYDPQGYQVANPLNRFAVSSWMSFHVNPDGSLDLYFQNESPGGEREGQLAAGAEGSGRGRRPEPSAPGVFERGTSS
jgi:hypothetical protein